MRLKGVVLAGGRSLRFGSDKALAKVGGMTMLERSVALLRQVGLEPLVVTEASRKYGSLDSPVLEDCVFQKGPLGGLYTVFQHFGKGTFLVLTCDMPFVTKEVLLALMQNHSTTSRITLFEEPGGEAQPFPGVYDARLKPVLFEFIERGELSLKALLGSAGPVSFIRSPFRKDVFSNLNSQEEWRLLQGCGA